MDALQAVVLDFDDTLCLTEEAAFHLENAVLAELGRGPMTRSIHKSTWGEPLYDAMALRSPGVDQDLFWQALPTVHEAFIQDGRIDAVPEANLAALDELAGVGFQLFLLTSRTTVELRHIMDPAHHLSGRLAGIYHKDNTLYHKPDPRVFEVIERDHGIAPQNCVYIGDSPSDAAAATGAGLHFIASLESGIRSRADFASYNVAAFVDAFPDIVPAIHALRSAYVTRV